MYDVNYESAVATIREYLERFENIETCGRNGSATATTTRITRCGRALLAT